MAKGGQGRGGGQDGRQPDPPGRSELSVIRWGCGTLVSTDGAVCSDLWALDWHLCGHGQVAWDLGEVPREGSARGTLGALAVWGLSGQDRLTEVRGRGPAQASRSYRHVPAVRSGFLHLADALAFRGDMEVVSSTVRALVATLRSGEKCGVEPELVSKGTRGLGL